MREILAAVLNLGMDRSGESLLVGALSHAKALLISSKELGRLYLFSIGKSCEGFESKVNANGRGYLSSLSLWYFNWDVHIPSPLRVLRERTTVFDGALSGERPRQKHAEEDSSELDGISFDRDVPSSERNPSKVFLGSPPKEWAFMLPSALDVLLADGVNRVAIKAKIFARSNCEIDQVKSGGPLLAKTNAKLLRFIAEVPNIVYCAGLFPEFSVKAFDSVAIDFNHRYILPSYCFGGVA